MKVFHIITGLDTGGAEMMLYKLLSTIDRTRFDPCVISLLDKGIIGHRIETLGVPVYALNMQRSSFPPVSFLKVLRWIKQMQPDLIQTWMYHADLMGGLAAKFSRGIPVIWGIHQSNLGSEVNKQTTLWIAKICAWFSNWLPTRIVCCSETSQRVHVEFGYSDSQMMAIPMGFDMEVFKPDINAKQLLREELGLSEKTLIVGFIGRFHPQKDHQNFIAAAAKLRSDLTDVHFVCCGEGIDRENTVLAKWLNQAGVSDCFHLLGRRNDIPKITAGLNIASISSCGEGFPNVIGEAMSCGVPCVVTDVGDSAKIVGDTGWVVPPRDPEALAQGWKKLIEMGSERRTALGLKARQRIAENFSLDAIVKKYESLYLELFNSKNHTIH